MRNFLFYQLDGGEDSVVAFSGIGEVAFVVVPCEGYSTVFYGCGILHVDGSTARFLFPADIAEIADIFSPHTDFTDTTDNIYRGLRIMPYLPFLSVGRTSPW